MTRALGLGGLVLVAVLVSVWALGGLDRAEAMAVAAQRAFRDDLAATLRALRAGEAGALWALVGLAFGYGVLHAAGPGHGKVLIGGYGVARRVALVRLAVLALVSSLMQATVAVGLVYGGLGLFGATREAIGAAGDGWMVAVGHGMMAAIGIWLVWRGLAGMRRVVAGPVAHHHAHRDDHDERHHHRHHDACDTCGHRHAPSLAQVQAVAGWREMAVLVAGIAIRPCTGALMLLVLTWQLGLVWTGIVSAYAMGLGTALVTVVVAVLAVTAREGAFAGFPGLARARAALPVVEIAAGGLVAIVALSLLARD